MPNCTVAGADGIEAAAQLHLAGGAASVPAGGACDDLGAWARSTVAVQLAPWNRTGVTEEMRRGASNYEPNVGAGRAHHIEVRSGEVLGKNDWAKYLRRAARQWPFPRNELRDFIAESVNVDWPLMMKGDPRADPSRAGPVFANANNGRFWNIMMPVQSRPQFGDGFVADRARALETGGKVPWKERKDVAVWRGNFGCSIGCGPRGAAYFPDNHVEECVDDSPHWDPNKVGFMFGCGEENHTKRGAWMKHHRVELVRYSAACGRQCGIDAKFPGARFEHRHMVENYIGKNLSAWLGGYMDDNRTSAHRYVFHVGNNGYADRSWRMFALGSTVLLVDNGWQEWYFSLLKPFVHYIPIRGDASDACEKLHWARAHPEEAEAIANRGRAFIQGCFTLDLVNLYCAEVMRQLGALWARGHKG